MSEVSRIGRVSTNNWGPLMSANKSSQVVDRNFRLLTPTAAFEAYCNRERRRLEASDTSFDPALFADARAFVLSRLESGGQKS